MKKNELDPYFTTYIWLVKMTSNKHTPFYLTSFERELLGCIISLNRGRLCNARDSYFASLFNVSIKHVNTSISKLKRMGFIKVNNNGKQRTIENRVEKEGALYTRDDEYAYVMDLKGFLKFRLKDVDYFPDNFFDLPRNKDGFVELPRSY